MQSRGFEPRCSWLDDQCSFHAMSHFLFRTSEHGLTPVHARPLWELRLQLWETYTEMDKRPVICPEESDGAEGGA